MLAHLGAMLAHLGSMLGPCSPILGLCWGYVATSWPASCWAMLWAMLDRRAPPEVILGYVVFMTSPSFPKFCLKKLSPVACKAPTSFLQHHFSEKAESCWGRAHPWWEPEGSHQWPARFQETLPEGRKRGSAAPGGCPVAEATIQATTSLPLHGMAGFKGCRPVPPTPEVFIMGPEGVPR